MKKIIRVCIFLLLLGCVLVGVTIFLQPRIPEFYKETEWDVLFFGTSETYCTFNPTVFEEYGIKSYNRGRQQQTMNMTYYYVKDALENADVDVVVLETWGMSYHEGNERFTDLSILDSSLNNMQNSKVKVETILNCVPEIQRWDYLLGLGRYHGRWEEINKSFFSKYYKEENNGYYAWAAVEACGYMSQEEAFSEQRVDLYDLNVEYLDKIYQLCVENNTQLVLVKAPFPFWGDAVGVANSVSDWAYNNGVTFINYMQLTNEIGLDCSQDSLDGGEHLNVYGAEKVSKHLAEYLLSILE